MTPTVTALFSLYAVVRQVQYLKILIFDFLGRGQKDPNPHVILPRDTKSAIETNYNKLSVQGHGMKHSLKKHSFIVKKRILYCKKMRDLPAMDRLQKLQEIIDSLLKGLVVSEILPLSEDTTNNPFSDALIQFGISSLLIV